MHFSFSLSHDILFCALFCNIDIVPSSLLTIENFVIAEYRGTNSELEYLRPALTSASASASASLIQTQVLTILGTLSCLILGLRHAV